MERTRGEEEGCGLGILLEFARHAAACPRQSPKLHAFHCGVISLESHNIQDAIADEIIELANKLAEANPDTEPWEIADGILSGAVHWWLYANAPCDNPACENCASIRTADLRMQTLRKLITEMAETSEYIESPNDTTVAHH